MAAKASTLDLIAKARWQGSKKFPYLSRGLWALTFIETDAVPTMAVDRQWRVYVNPKHVAECLAESFDAVITGVVHECLHVTLRHAERAKTVRAEDHERWNCAGDCELVQSIQAAGIKIWSKDLTPDAMGWPRDLSAEEYYKLPRKGRGGGQGQGQGQGQGGSGQGQGGKAECSGGSGVTGQAAPWELPHGKGPAGLSEAEGDVVRAVVAQAIREHAESHGIGTVPGGLLRWAETMHAPPVIDWGLLVGARVRYYIDTHLGPVASYARPSRREAGGLVLPVHRNPRANVIVVGDTSGSMGDTDIGKVIGVVHSGIEALGTIKALGCDAAAVDPVEVRTLDDLREALAGGGGTDMSVGIARADQDAPDAIVVVTDGDTPWPSSPPDAPVVVVLTRNPHFCAPPAWADVIDASDIAAESSADDD